MDAMNPLLPPLPPGHPLDPRRGGTGKTTTPLVPTALIEKMRREREAEMRSVLQDVADEALAASGERPALPRVTIPLPRTSEEDAL